MSGRVALLVAACGWRHVGWQGDFYPEDLPEEWQLSYYANEFHAVLVPEADWRAASEATCAGWCDEVPERFRFFFAASEPLDEAARARLQRVFGSHYGGVPGEEASALPRSLPDDARGLRAVIEQLAAADVVQPVLFVDGQPPSLEMLRQALVITQLLGVA